MDNLNKILLIIKNNFPKKNIKYDELLIVINKYYPDILKINPNLTIFDFEDIVKQFYSKEYQYRELSSFNFRNLDKKLQIDEINQSLLLKLDIPKDKKDLYKHFMKLYNTPQPEQRSQEWYDYRKCRITASDCASALDLNPYECVENFILKKCDPNYPFRDNPFVVHGKKYEQIATMLYEHLFNVKVTEFGCLPSDKYPFLGASPDGICSVSTLDYKFSGKLGTMLEIKCPYKRPIETKGEINGTICPNYYYWQIQQQLQCCDLSNCDFWQCNIVEYNNREEYLTDNFNDYVITSGTNSEKMDFDKKCCQGCLIQLYPKNFEKRWTKEDILKELKPWELPNNAEDDCHYYQAVYIYPPRLNMTKDEYNDWIINTISTWKDNYPQWKDDYYFNQVLYWKIPNSHNVNITRDDKLFEKYLPVLKECMEKIEHYRNNPKEIKLLQKIADKRSQYTYFTNTKKIKHNYKISNFKKEKIKFLEPNKVSSINKTITNKSFINNADFLD